MTTEQETGRKGTVEERVTEAVREQRARIKGAKERWPQAFHSTPDPSPWDVPKNRRNPAEELVNEAPLWVLLALAGLYPLSRWKDWSLCETARRFGLDQYKRRTD